MSNVVWAPDRGRTDLGQRIVPLALGKLRHYQRTLANAGWTHPTTDPQHMTDEEMHALLDAHSAYCMYTAHGVSPVKQEES